MPVVSGPLHLLIDKPNKTPASSRSLAATWRQNHIVELFKRLVNAIDNKLVDIAWTLAFIK
jgi:hypothetical protein